MLQILHFQYLKCIIFFQGMWIGMLCGEGVQSLVLIYMTWRTDWDDQVDK